MPRAGLSPTAVVDAGLALVDEQGAQALTLAAVAARTGVAAPSLYKHVGGLADLRAMVARRIMDEMTDRFATAIAGRSADDAVAALMTTYRSYVLEHPHRYAAVPADPLHDTALHAAGARMLAIFLAVLRGYGLSEPAAVHATRCLRAVVHGFATIQAAGGFGLPEDLDQTYRHLIDMYLASLARPA